MKYSAGYNMPGYMPEMDPFETDDFDDAREFIVDELDNAGDIAANSDDADAANECEDAKEDAENWTATGGNMYWSAYCDGYVYWITELT